jgi:hypothetical protein
MADKYDYLAEFIYTNISKEDIRSLSRELENEKYVENPKEFTKTLDEFFQNKWDKLAPVKPRTGNKQTQKENFHEFLRKDILSQKRLSIDNPYSKEKMDFGKYFSKYRELTGQVYGPYELSPKQEKLIRIAEGKEKIVIDEKIEKYPQGEYYRMYSTNIENAAKAGRINSVVKLRDAMRDMMVSGRKEKPINSFQASELYNKADKALEPYYKKYPKFGEIRKPSKKFYVMSDDLPTSEKRISKLAAEYKKEIPETEKERLAKEISTNFLYLSKDEIKREVNKRIAEKIIDAPILDREIERRYMTWKYNNPNKPLTFEDKVGISKLTNREFKFEIGTKINRIPDPKHPGKTKITYDYISKEPFKLYQYKLREEVSNAQKRIEEDMKKQEQIIEEQLAKQANTNSQ